MTAQCWIDYFRGVYSSLFPPPGEGNILAVRKNIAWKKGSNIIFHILRLLGRISSGEKGKETKISGKKIKIYKNGGGEEYQVVGNFICTPLGYFSSS